VIVETEVFCSDFNNQNIYASGLDVTFLLRQCIVSFHLSVNIIEICILHFNATNNNVAMNPITIFKVSDYIVYAGLRCIKIVVR
jgi:hypothetical protein